MPVKVQHVWEFAKFPRVWRSNACSHFAYWDDYAKQFNGVVRGAFGTVTRYSSSDLDKVLDCLEREPSHND